MLYTAVTGADGRPGEAERALIDPMAIDPSGTTTLDSWQPDHEGRLLAYQLSEGGREESVLRVMDVATGADVDGPIDRCRYTEVAWLPGGKAFYYARRLPPGQVPAGEEQFHRRVYLHRVGTPAQDDVLIHGDGLDKINYYGVLVSRDGRWLIIDASAGTAPRNDVWIADLTASRGGRARTSRCSSRAWTPWSGCARAGTGGCTCSPTGTRRAAGWPWPTRPTRAFPGLCELAGRAARGPRGGARRATPILDGAELDRPLLVAARTRHAISEVSVHDLATGAVVGERLPLPGLGSVSGLRGRPAGGHEAWFSYTDHATPPVVLHYDARTGATPDLGPLARRRGRAGHPDRAGRLPVRRRHHDPDAGHLPCRGRRRAGPGPGPVPGRGRRGPRSCTATAASTSA